MPNIIPCSSKDRLRVNIAWVIYHGGTAPACLRTAEWALISLRTNWFGDLCSCCIYRTEAVDLRTTLRARISRVEHKCTDTGIPTDVSQCCEEELINMHILRRGVLPVEIALGYPISDLGFNPRTREIEINDGLDTRNPERTQVLHRREKERKLQSTMGEDFKDAVNYCLQQKNTPRGIGKADLDNFHADIVEP